LLLCVAFVAANDISATWFKNFNSNKWNFTADGDDTLLALTFDTPLEGSEPLSSLFSDVKFDAAEFEVQSCPGVCQNTANSCSGGYQSGLCPGPSNIKCCKMSTSSCSGQCQDTSLSCSTGYQTGKCPGPSNIKCCPTGGPGGDHTAQRAALRVAAMALYNNRAHEHYTQGSQRWSGITNGIRPPNAPPYSDCSAAVTWCYWTVFGSGPDFLNGQSWRAGYTGSMSGRGRSVSCGSMQSGDLAFYGSPISHVAISIGGGLVVSHGSDPVGQYSYNYRSDLNQCRTYL